MDKVVRTIDGHWLVSWTVRVSSSHTASVANSPSGLLVLSAVRYVPRTMTSAASRAAATSPREWSNFHGSTTCCALGSCRSSSGSPASYSACTSRAAAAACSGVSATTKAMCCPWCMIRSLRSGAGGACPSTVVGPAPTCGAFSWVSTAITPGERSASSVSMRTIRPAAMVLCTRAP